MTGAPPPPPSPAPTRPTFREFHRRHRGFVAALVIIAATLIAIDAWLVTRRTRYLEQTASLRARMSEVERNRADAVDASQEKRFRIMLQLLRRQARTAKDIHLAVEVDSGRMYLERDGALLRVIPVQVGPASRIGTPPDTVELAVPRGTRSVVAVLGADDAWKIPTWVYAARGLRAPADRVVKQALGPVAIVLDGGTVIYSLPAVGPLEDSAYVLPGSVRARAADLEAIVPNLARGTTVYFY